MVVPDRSSSTQLVSVKLFVIAVLTAALFVPLTMVWALTGERAGRRDEVAREVGGVWGRRQTVGGFALLIPYQSVTVTNGTTTRAPGNLVVLPASLEMDVRLTPEVRRRSIFTVNLYRAAVVASGTFDPPDLAGLGVAPDQVDWNGAALTAGVSDLRGVVSLASATWGGQPLAFEPAGDATPFSAALRAQSPMTSSGSVPFRVELTIAGSDGLMFLPSGANTAVTLAAPWPTPGFVGAQLPASHDVTADAFRAEWVSNFIARPFPRAWIAGAAQNVGDKFAGSTFGVDLVTAVDHYQQTERAVKYGFLFIALTFGLFFVWEVMAGLRLHPVQYLLVGLALVVFYLLLLSIAEQVRFAVAYAVASVATVSLVGAYARRILGGTRSGSVIAAALGVLYGLLFVLLGLEDLALLVGAVAVFVALAVTMYLTRGIDWYGSRHSTGGV